MRSGWWIAWTAVLATRVLTAAVAEAELRGSFDGGMAGPRIVQVVSAAATLSQVGSALTGTLAIEGYGVPLSGAYLINGRATAKRLRVSGVNASGALLKWRAKIVGGALQGKARLKAAGVRAAGTLSLTANVSTADGSACDAVFTQNSTFFTDQVLGQAMPSCPACHVAGGQADATRLRITPLDPLATARSIALLVDATQPESSRLVQKPLGLLPHGGGQQITPGSAEEQILRQWIDLVAQARCS